MPYSDINLRKGGGKGKLAGRRAGYHLKVKRIGS